MREIALALVLVVAASTSAIADDQQPKCDLAESATVEQVRTDFAAAESGERALLVAIPGNCTIPNRLQYREEEETDTALGACSTTFTQWTDRYPTKNKPRRKIDDCMLALLYEHLVYAMGGSSFRNNCKFVLLDPSRKVQGACNTLERDLQSHADSANIRAAALTKILQ
jgi:hypothetical protein